MLVLSRRTGQKIVIGNEVEIEVIAVNGEGVRLGITAPGDMSIHRYEVFSEIRQANSAASIAVGEIDGNALENVLAQMRPRIK